MLMSSVSLGVLEDFFGDHDAIKVFAIITFLHCEVSDKKFIEFFFLS